MLLSWPEGSASLDPNGLIDGGHILSVWLLKLQYSDTKLDPFVATDIAPWIPQACRSEVVFNTEFQKRSSKATKPIGCPKRLSELIFRGPLESPSFVCRDAP